MMSSYPRRRLHPGAYAKHSAFADMLMSRLGSQSVSQFAALLGVSQSTVSRWLIAGAPPPPIEQVVAVAKLFGEDSLPWLRTAYPDLPWGKQATTEVDEWAVLPPAIRSLSGYLGRIYGHLPAGSARDHLVQAVQQEADLIWRVAHNQEPPDAAPSPALPEL